MTQSRLDEQFRHLQSADLIRLVQNEPELEYWFKHAAIQEAVYGSLLKSTRAELHRRVAEAVERSLPEEAPERAAMLALHYERAGRPREALCYALDAGDRALRTSAPREAAGFFERALAMTKQIPEIQPQTTHLAFAGRGRALQAQGDNFAALENFQQMLQAAERSGDPLLQVDALNYLVPLRVLLQGFSPEVEANLDLALRLTTTAGGPLLRARTLWNAGLAYRFHDPQRALPYLEQALAIAEAGAANDERMAELQGYVLNDMAVVGFVMGRMVRYEPFLARASEIFRALGHRSMLADTLGGRSWLNWFGGRPALSRMYAEEGLRESLEIGNMWAATYNYISLIALAADAGRVEEALALGAVGLEHARAAGFPAFVGVLQSELAPVHLLLGQRASAEAAASEAVSAFEAMRAPMWSAAALGVRARLALVRGAPQEAWQAVRSLLPYDESRQKDMEGVLLSATTILQATLASGHAADGLAFCDWVIAYTQQEGLSSLQGEARLWCGLARESLGDAEGAKGDLLVARELLAQAEAPILLWQVDVALGNVHAALGEDAPARMARLRARATVEAIAAGIKDPGLRRGFLDQPEVARLLAA